MAAKLDIEAIKKEKDGLDVIHDIRRYASEGFATIDPKDFPLFRWYGLYQQRPNEGHFMLRVKVPGGRLSTVQLREIGQIAIDHGRDLADITTRQTFQYHWLTIDKVPEVFERLQAVGIITAGACGDITRNIVSCPVAGMDADEILDAQPLVEEMTTFMSTNKDFSNFPRKYKVSISGCGIHCAQPEINCLSFYGARRTAADGNVEAGFGLMVGGGLSTRPFFGSDMRTFIRPDQVKRTMVAVSEIYRDALALRQDRGRARLKFLLHDPKIGIGAEKFREMLQEKLDFQLPESGPYPFPDQAECDHLGIRRQKQDGLWYVGVGVRAGRLTGDKLKRIADLADEFSVEKQIRTTCKQNFIVPHVPEDKLEALKARLTELGLDWKPSVFKRALVSCTGTEFCNLAVTETKEVGRRVSRELEARFPDATRNLRVHFSGCPNNCGQNAIADIGLRGGKTKGADGVMVEAFDILVGGGTGAQRAFGEVCTKKFPSDTIATAIGNLYQGFIDWTADDTRTFYDYVNSHAPEQLDAVARGLPVPTAEEIAAKAAAAAEAAAARPVTVVTNAAAPAPEID